MTKDEILSFFQEFNIHIGDGVDNCSGEDFQAMDEAATELVNRLKPKSDGRDWPELTGG